MTKNHIARNIQVKAVFEEYVTISPGSAYIIGKKINFNNHI